MGIGDSILLLITALITGWWRPIFTAFFLIYIALIIATAIAVICGPNRYIKRSFETSKKKNGTRTLWHPFDSL